MGVTARVKSSAGDSTQGKAQRRADGSAGHSPVALFLFSSLSCVRGGTRGLGGVGGCCVGGCGVRGCGVGGAGARLFFLCRSTWDPRDIWEAQREATVKVRAALSGSGVHVGCSSQRSWPVGPGAPRSVGRLLGSFWGPRAGSRCPGVTACRGAKEWPRGGPRRLTDILRPLGATSKAGALPHIA